MNEKRRASTKLACSRDVTEMVGNIHFNLTRCKRNNRDATPIYETSHLIFYASWSEIDKTKF